MTSGFIMRGQNTILTALYLLLLTKQQQWDTSNVMNLEKQRFSYLTNQTIAESEPYFSQFMT